MTQFEPRCRALYPCAIFAPSRDRNMRLKKPTHVLIDQVRITREHADPNLSGARITGVGTMTGAEIVERYNEILHFQGALREAWDQTVIEEPPLQKQIDYHEKSDQ